MNPAPAKHRVLVIDDSRALHEDFRKIFGVDDAEDPALVAAEVALFGEESRLVASPRFELSSAFDGHQALAMVRRALAEGRSYSIAFIDVRMAPGLDGIETTARIWQDDPDIQVVLCTAHSDFSLNDILGKFGHTDRLVILKKPFDNIEIVQLARTLAERARRTQAARRQLDRLEGLVSRRDQQLASAHARFRRLVASAGVVSWVMSLEDGACSEIQGPVEGRWGWPAARFSDPGFLIGCLHPDDRDSFRSALETLAREGEMSLDCRVLRPRGPSLAVRILMIASSQDDADAGVAYGLLLERPRAKRRPEVSGRMRAERAPPDCTP